MFRFRTVRAILYVHMTSCHVVLNMTKRKDPLPDSMKANPAAQRKLAQLIDGGVIKPTHDPWKYYSQPEFKNFFCSVAREKFRKAFFYGLYKKYGEDEVKAMRKSGVDLSKFSFYACFTSY